MATGQGEALDTSLDTMYVRRVCVTSTYVIGRLNMMSLEERSIGVQAVQQCTVVDRCVFYVSHVNLH